MSLPVTGQLALVSKPELFGTKWSAFLAHWSDTNVLTLAIDEDCFWQDPLGSKSLMILVHSASHARNMHHGKSFVEEVERLAGVAAAVLFAKYDEMRRRWPELVGDILVAGLERGEHHEKDRIDSRNADQN